MVRRFIKGLTYGIKVVMARELEIGTTFNQAVEIDWQFMRIRSQGREAIVRDKRPYRSSNFSGTSSGGRVQFGRGLHGRPAYLHNMQPLEQWLDLFLAHQFHHLLVLSSKFVPCSVYSCHQGQVHVHQPQSARGCYECRELRHMRRQCPRLVRGVALQSSHLVLPAPVSPCPSQSA